MAWHLHAMEILLVCKQFLKLNRKMDAYLDNVRMSFENFLNKQTSVVGDNGHM